MSKKKKQAGHVNHERWLVSYADFITLLFAVFVVMYAASQTDQKKIGQLSQAIQVAFQDLGLFQPSTTRATVNSRDSMPFADAQMLESIDSSITSASLAPNMAATPFNPRDELKQKLTKSLSGEIARKQVELRDTPDGLVLSLHEMGFYASGSDVLVETSRSTLDRVAEILAPTGLRVRIEGHTDNTPIHNLRFNSNWELSAARATGLVRVFIERYRFSPAQLSAAGYGEYHPVAPNDSPEGQARNRRVDLVILNSPADTTHYRAGAETRSAREALGKVAPALPPSPKVISESPQ